jgi:hypothetical protein
MASSRRLGRRSFLTRIMGGVAAGGALALVTGSAAAQRTATYTGVTDCDTGNPQDSPGYGTGVRNQYTDRDTGPLADARCQGRGPSGAGQNQPSGLQSGAGTRCSDRDPTDPGGRGRNCTYESGTPTATGCTDSDPGGTGDPVGNGRHCGRSTTPSNQRPRSGCSDSDPTDPGLDGTHCSTH